MELYTPPPHYPLYIPHSPSSPVYRRGSYSRTRRCGGRGGRRGASSPCCGSTLAQSPSSGGPGPGQMCCKPFQYSLHYFYKKTDLRINVPKNYSVQIFFYKICIKITFLGKTNLVLTFLITGTWYNIKRICKCHLHVLSVVISGVL